MKYSPAALAAVVFGIAGVAHAQNTPSADKPSTMKLTQSECTSLWQKANGTAKGLTEAQAKPYVTDFKAANPDGDTTIDQNEWMAACNKGLVHSSSSSGASTGTSGSSTAPKAR
jgi:hypothetical protein